MFLLEREGEVAKGPGERNPGLLSQCFVDVGDVEGDKVWWPLCFQWDWGIAEGEREKKRVGSLKRVGKSQVSEMIRCHDIGKALRITKH